MANKVHPSFRSAELKNEFLLMRHGQSVANVQSLIVSSPQSGLSDYGLTDLGRSQVLRTVESNLNRLCDLSAIFTSDFRRTRETAIAVESLTRIGVNEATELRERYFGEWDGRSNRHYEEVWLADENDASHQRWNVESVTAVAERMTAFVDRIDATSRGKKYLLVSHGDPLQILITSASGGDLRRHRHQQPLETAELRSLSISNHLPEKASPDNS